MLLTVVLCLLPLPTSTLSTSTIPHWTKHPLETITPTPADNTAEVEITSSEEDVYLVLPVNQVGVLECTSSSLQDTTLHWYKNDELLTSSVDGVRKVFLPVNGTLMTAAGLYTCLTNSESKKSIKVFIEGEEVPVSGPREVEVERGESAVLTTTLTVHPVHRMEFKLMFTRVRDKDVLIAASHPEHDLSEGVIVSATSNSLRYEINETVPRDHGLYKFIVQYGDRTLVYEHFLTVRYQPKIISFQDIPDFVSVNEGHKTLTVNVSGYPAPAITWWHAPCCPDEDPINITDVVAQDSNEYNFYHLTNDGTMLNLLGGTRKFNGSYWFEATNELGSIKSDTTYYRLRGYGITVNAGLKGNVSSLVQFENIDSLQITCVVNRVLLDPTTSTDPVIVWYHDGVEISNTITRSNDTEVKQLLQIDNPSLETAGAYNCIAQTDIQQLWSFVVDVTVVKQPVISVSPQVYRAAVGATVIFSCLVDNIDGARSVDWNVVYKVKEQEQEFEDISQTRSGTRDGGLLYLSQQEEEDNIRCLTSPSQHSDPVYRDGRVEVVEHPPVTVTVTTNKKRYTEGETLIMRCAMTSDILETSSPNIFWKHGDVAIATHGTGVLTDGRVAERYFTKDDQEQTTDVLVMENLSEDSAGTYTCVFDAGEDGRYEGSYDITVHPSTPVNAIALIISVCFVLILVITMGVVLLLIIRRSRTRSYLTVAEKQSSQMLRTSL